ncbi:MAG: response regulator transcription factor, partial [Desulfobacterales bacterium]
RTRNVCAGGAFFPTDHPLPAGTRVKIRILLSFDELKRLRGKHPIIEVTGQIIRTEKQGMAVRFDKKNNEILFPSEEISVHIIGPGRLQNRVLVFFLEKKAGLKCSCATFSDSFQEMELKHGKRCLVLIDCLGLNLAELHHRTEIRKYLRNPDIILSFFNFCADRQIESEMLEAGVRGVFHQDEEPDRFIEGIAKLMSNELHFSGEAFSDYILSNHKAKKDSEKTVDCPRLTAREKEILVCILAEKSNKEIADRLCISTHTVKTHLFNVFKKIKVKNRLQALFWAAKNL